MAEKEERAHFEEHVDGSIIATFPPGFFQRGETYLKNQKPGEQRQFTLDVQGKTLFLRGSKLPASYQPLDEPVKKTTLRKLPMNLETVFDAPPSSNENIV